MKKLIFLLLLTGCMQSRNSRSDISYVCEEDPITTVYRINSDECPTNTGVLYAEGVDLNCDTLVDIDEADFAALYCDPDSKPEEEDPPPPPKKVKDKKHEHHEDCDHMHGRHHSK